MKKITSCFWVFYFALSISVSSSAQYCTELDSIHKVYGMDMGVYKNFFDSSDCHAFFWVKGREFLQNMPQYSIEGESFTTEEGFIIKSLKMYYGQRVPHNHYLNQDSIVFDTSNVVLSLLKITDETTGRSGFTLLFDVRAKKQIKRENLKKPLSVIETKIDQDTLYVLTGNKYGYYALTKITLAYHNTIFFPDYDIDELKHVPSNKKKFSTVNNPNIYVMTKMVGKTTSLGKYLGEGKPQIIIDIDGRITSSGEFKSNCGKKYRPSKGERNCL